MSATVDKIATLLIGHINGTLDPADQALLDQWMAASPANQAFASEFIEEAALKARLEDVFSKEVVWQRLKKVVDQEKQPSTFLRYWIAAACIVLALGAGVWFFLGRNEKSYTAQQPAIKQNDLPPGSNRAMLTINNNQNIDLSSDKTGININNTITYNDGEKIADAGQMLQLTTPRGGQYQAVLPDGSKVWLNAASSIKFPSKFNDKERRVEVTGEAYIEVAKNKAKPFFVNVDGQTTVQVLGTSFNINSYRDEGEITTTLIDGSIRVLMTGRSGRNDQNKSNDQDGVILKPGQQAILRMSNQAWNNNMGTGLNGRYDQGSIQIQSANIDQILSWKNGVFSFDRTDVRLVMRQLERWYDITVRYEGIMPNILFSGKVYRSAHLSEVLDMIKEMGVNYRMEGKTLIVF